MPTHNFLYLLKKKLRKSQMSLFDWQPTHEELRAREAHQRRLKSGNIVQVAATQAKTKVKDPAPIPKGTRVLYKTPDMPRKKKGTIISGDHRTGYTIKPNREGYQLNPPPVYAPREHIWTHTEHKLIVAPKRQAVTPQVSVQRKEEGTAKVGMTEADILKHPAFVKPMKQTLSHLAGKNGFNPHFQEQGGVLTTDDPQANELFSEYIVGAIGAFRAASSKAEPADISEFNNHLNGISTQSRIMMQMHRTGKTTAIRHLIANNDRLQEEQSYDSSMEDDMESGMRQVAADAVADIGTRQTGADKIALETGIMQQLKRLDDPVAEAIIKMKFGLGKFDKGHKNQDIAAALNRSKVPHGDDGKWDADKVQQRMTAALASLARTKGMKDLLGFLKSLGKWYAGEELIKSHVKQYTRQDGTVVQEHDDKRVKKHQDLIGHQNNHKEELHTGAKLEHGEELISHLRSQGWKEREVSVVRSKNGLVAGKKEDMPEHEEIKAKNRDNTALQTAERQMKKMHEAAMASDDPVAVLQHMNTSRSNTYTAAIDDYREKLLNHFGHEVDRNKTATKFEKDGHAIVIGKDGDKHTVHYAGADTSKSKDAITSLQGKKQVEAVDTGKKEAQFIVGRANKAYTAKLNPVHSKYALVEADQLTTSHTLQGHINRAYPQEIQPRERERLSSQMQMANIMQDIKPELFGHSATAADGAPIVGKDGAVESGNGRTIALAGAYERGLADKYKEWLKQEAESFGLKPEDVEGMQAPMLVRLRDDDDPNTDRAEFAREANQSSNLGSSPAEQAWSDSARIDDALLKKFTVDEDGEIYNDDNMDFINGFLGKLGKNEAASLRDADGDPNKKAIERIQNAVFTKVYGSSMLTELQAESAKPKIRNVLKALNSCVGDFAQTKQHDDLDVVPDMMEAIEYYLGHQNESRAELEHKLKNAGELNFTGDAPVFKTEHATNMILAIADRSGSRSKIENVFRSISNEIKNEVAQRDNPEVDMFSGPYQPRNKEQVVKQALDKVGNDVQKALAGLHLLRKSHVKATNFINAHGTAVSRREYENKVYHLAALDQMQHIIEKQGIESRTYGKRISTTRDKHLNNYLGSQGLPLFRIHLNKDSIAANHKIRPVTYESGTGIKFTGEREEEIHAHHIPIKHFIQIEPIHENIAKASRGLDPNDE